MPKPRPQPPAPILDGGSRPVVSPPRVWEEPSSASDKSPVAPGGP